MTGWAEGCAISGSVARGLLSPVRGDVVGELAQRAEDVLVLLAVGAQLHAVLLGYDQCDFQDVDRVQAQALAVQGRVRIDVGGRPGPGDGRDDEAGDLPPRVRGPGRGGWQTPRRTR